MMAALDGETSPQEEQELSRLLQNDPVLVAEWEQLQRVKEVTKGMVFNKPPEEIWDTYWTGVYRRFERGIGWILMSVGAILLLSYGAWEGLRELLDDTTTPAIVKYGALAAIVGFIVLLVSVVREKLFVRRSDPYKDIIR
jgi:ferric-dicitrate binding protein FerR (iron transport regulator)